MKPINIILTTYCNQNCKFCFASREMQENGKSTKFGLPEYRRLIDDKKKSGKPTGVIKLLGGEPTLHPKFDKILEYSLHQFEKVQLFTNGIFGMEVKNAIQHYTSRISLIFNIMTPGYQFDKNIQNLVNENISYLSRKGEVILSITINPFTNINSIVTNLRKISDNPITGFRIGIENPISGYGNNYEFYQFPSIGTKVVNFIKSINRFKKSYRFLLNCGLTKCMFTKKQLDYISKKKAIIDGWGCFGKSGSMDINPSLESYQCFPLSKVNRVVGDSPKTAHRKILAKQYKLWHRYQLVMCRKCSIYGHIPGKCPGPCIAFRMNKVLSNK